MPIVINFFRFAGGAILRFLPIIGSMIAVFVGELKNNKQLLKWAPIVVGVAVLLYYLYTKEEKLLLKDLAKDGDAGKEAELIAKYLGTRKGSPWYSWDTYSEDENSVLELLKDTESSISEIERHYNKISKSGSLIDDIARYFSDKQVEEFYKITNYK